ncbi:8-oxo-dGTP diphosphatase MutT [Shewanella waksmanii]|uniref:8-oxo-dGTP diphosphatase MutT n=1 Tax=Shewanella waksmanii TaxID=213783 RepID=UPI0037350FB5
MKRVHVAVAVILSKSNQVLIAKRHAHLHQGGKWEFPGGKVENTENTEAAIIRELKEEVDLQVTSSMPFMTISHDYSDKQVLLDIHTVTNFTGEAKGNEGQQIKWVTITELAAIDFPEANKAIVAKLQQQYL